MIPESYQDNQNNASEKEKKHELAFFYREMATNEFSIICHIFDLLTPSERKILCMLYDMELKRQNNIYTAVFPSINKIEQVTDVCETTVHKFVRKFKKDPVLKNLLKISERKNTSHLFEMSLDLFFFLSYLKMEGALYNWKAHKSRILGYVHNSKEVIISRLECRFEKLSTSKVHPLTPKKCTLLNVLTKYFRRKVPNMGASPPVPSFSNKKEIDENSIVFNFGSISLISSQKSYFINNYPIPVLKKAVDDKNFYLENGKYIRNEFAFLYSRCKEHDLTRFR